VIDLLLVEESFIGPLTLIATSLSFNLLYPIDLLGELIYEELKEGNL